MTTVGIAGADGAPVIVIGAGIVGVMTAWALSRKGLRPVVLDALEGPAELCSRANAGILAVGHAKAWAGPSALAPMLRAMAGRDPSVRVSAPFDPNLWRWGLGFLRQCTAKAHAENTARLQRLSLLSRNMLSAAEGEMGLPKETRHDGGLYLFQDKAQFERYATTLRASGDDCFELLGRDGILAREPGLASMGDSLVGGLYSAVDSVGDCHLFARRVSAWLVKHDRAEFRYNHRVTGLHRAGGRIDAVQTDRGEIACAAVILATGVETPDIAAPLGFRPNIYPVKGYSGTWRITDASRVPQLPFVDETALMAVASYGGFLRVTAIAEFARRDRTLRQTAIAQLDDYVRRCFVGAVDLDTAEYWAGLRPTTPAGPPYLGRVKLYDNLWINAGHGQLGWTMSLGAGAALAQAVAGEARIEAGLSSEASWLDSL